MLLSLLLLLSSLLFAYATQHPLTHHPQPPPTSAESLSPPLPSLNYLFTAHLSIRPNIAPLKPGPRGIRLDVPILGGKVEGRDGFKGKVLGGTSDWILVDPLSGIATADARWSIVIKNNLGDSPSSSSDPEEVESQIFVRTDGPSLPGVMGISKAHLRMRLETGSERWRWLNFVAPLGVLEILNPENTTQQEVRIDVFNLEGEWTKPSRDKAVAGLMT